MRVIMEYDTVLGLQYIRFEPIDYVESDEPIRNIYEEMSK